MRLVSSMACAAAAVTLVWPAPPQEPPPVGATAGSIVGVVTTRETQRASIRASIDAAVCGPSVPDESILIDRDGGLANVVVTVAGLVANPPSETVLVNERCRFVPRVALLRPGGVLRARSQDATLHTVHAAADRRPLFNVSIPVPEFTISRPLGRAGVVHLTCSTHPWMRGYLHVTDQLATITDTAGRFRFDGVPAGAYELHVWHEVLASNRVERVVVTTGETTTLPLTLSR